MDGCTDIWMAGQTDRSLWMDGQTEGQIDKNTNDAGKQYF